MSPGPRIYLATAARAGFNFTMNPVTRRFRATQPDLAEEDRAKWREAYARHRVKRAKNKRRREVAIRNLRCTARRKLAAAVPEKRPHYLALIACYDEELRRIEAYLKQHGTRAGLVAACWVPRPRAPWLRRVESISQGR